MTRIEFRDWLLVNMEDAKLASNGKQIVCRCHNCDDHGRHLYIGPFDGDESEPIYYHCFRCPKPFSGVVTKDFLDEYGTATSSDSSVNDLSKSKGPRKSKITNGRIYEVKYDFITDCELSRQKLAHINERLGRQFTYADCVANKIILNVFDIYKANPWLTSFTRSENIMKQFNTYFIGFLSRTNSSLNMRNLAQNKVDKSISSKYVNYNIINSNSDNDFYILPTVLDITKTVNVFVAEGPFDVLGIKYNVFPDVPNSVFIAGRGKAYDKIIFFLIETYGLYDLSINFFPDKDVSDYSIESIISNLAPYGFACKVYRNTYPGEKDFGVPMSRIRISGYTPRSW